MGLADPVPLVASPHVDDGDFGQENVPTDGSDYNLHVVLNTQTNISIIILDGECLELGPLARAGLLLYGHNL